MAEISASIVLYNSSIRDVAGLINSLINQFVARVFIVDNSDPGFDALAESNLPDRCVYIRAERNLGYGAGHNLALKQATGKFQYHIICNPDIELGPDTIRSLTSFMDTHSEVGISMPKLLNTDGSIQHCCRRSPLLWDYLSQLVLPSVGAKRRQRLEMRDHDYDQQMDVPCLSGCFLFARTSTLRALDGFDPHYFLYFEDFDLSMRARRLADTRYFPQTWVVHGRRSGHRHSWKLKWLFLRSALTYFNRWGYFRTSE